MVLLPIQHGEVQKVNDKKPNSPSFIYILADVWGAKTAANNDGIFRYFNFPVEDEDYVREWIPIFLDGFLTTIIFFKNEIYD